MRRLIEEIKNKLARGRRARGVLPSPSDLFEDANRAWAAKEWVRDWLALRQEIATQNVCNAANEEQLRNARAELRALRLLEQDIELAIHRGEDAARILSEAVSQ